MSRWLLHGAGTLITARNRSATIVCSLPIAFFFFFTARVLPFLGEAYLHAFHRQLLTCLPKE